MLRTLPLALLASTALAGIAHAAPVNTLSGNTLVTVDSAAPGTITASRAITGLRAGDSLLGLDYRPASNRVIYSTGVSGQLYAINPFTGAATQVGAPIAVPAIASAAAYDFNPSVDRLRVVLNDGTNLRLNPNNGAVAGVDAPVFYAVGDTGAGIAPQLTGAAYTNNVSGGTPTTLYVIDSGRDVLALQGSPNGAPVSPNTGQLTTVGALGVDTGNATGFDISASGQVAATLTNPTTGVTSLYSVNLTTGAATLIGQLGGVGQTYIGLAWAPQPFGTFGATANQNSVGGALDQFVGVPGAGLGALFASLDGLAPGNRADALSQLTPAAFSLLPEVVLRTAEFQELSIRRYLRDFRAGGTGVEGAAGVAEPASRGFAFWLQGSGRTGTYDARVDRPEVKYGAAGVIGGVDGRFGEQQLIGVYGGYDQADVRLGGATPRSDIDAWFAGAYGTFGIGPAYVDLFGSYSKGDLDLKRGVQFGTTNLAFQSETRSRTYLAGGTVGLSFNIGGFELEPFAGVRYAKLRIRGFDEGTDVGALTLDTNRYESILGNFGARLGAAFEIGGATVRPEVRGAYRREFEKDGRRAFFFDLAGTAGGSNLVFTPTPLNRTYYTAGTGFTVSGPTSPLSFVVDYNGEFSGGRDIHGISGGLRLTF